MRDTGEHEPAESRPEGPFNALPPVVVALSVVALGIEALFALGARGVIGGPEAAGWRLAAVTDYAFLIPVFDWMRATGQWPTEHLVRFVSYPLLHFGFTHALFAVVLMLAIGKVVAEVCGQAVFMLVVLAGSVAGALAYGIVLEDLHPLAGLYPAVFALLGVYGMMMWRDPGRLGSQRWGVFVLVAALIGVQLLFRMLFGGSNDWVADLGGFAAGLVLAPFVLPGGLAALIARLRER